MKMHTLTVSALALTLSAATFAQAPATAPGQAGGFGGGRAMRGQGGARALPFAMGQVTAVNAQAGTITITPQFPQGAEPQTIQVPQSAPINSMTDARVSDLKIGDQIAVTGMPTAMTAMQITVGQMPGAAGGGRAAGGFGGGGQGGFGGGQGAGGARAAAAGGRQPGAAQVSGKVTALSPLTISISPEASLVLKVASDTKVSKIAPVPLSTVKVGDSVMAMGQAGADGMFAANSVNLNMQMGGGMMGMMGGAGMRGMMGGQGAMGGGQAGTRRRNRGGAGAPAAPGDAPSL